ncbi:hypothetical protein MYCOZU1_05979 (plasmid) [Mycobacterium intracellulare subsp. chimaera]|jgi:hypothetical protein|nr:hypothetical protein MYCOZU1_05979 [Mycobacterium intracellulare subsp. chimaera]
MAGRKVDLATLGERVTVDLSPQPESAPNPPPAAATAPVASETAASTPAHHTPRRPARRSPRKPTPGQWVRYDELERKETRLRADQYGQLSDLSRSLNRLRAGRGERITENTLIRVAIDLLLSRESDLTGSTEIELRESVGL